MLKIARQIRGWLHAVILYKDICQSPLDGINRYAAAVAVRPTASAYFK